MANGSSISAQKGRNFLLSIDVSGQSPTVYTPVAGMRTTDMTIDGGPVDITNKGSNGWQEMLPDAGIKKANITAQGIYDANTQAPMVKLLESALAGGTFIDAEMTSGAGDKLIGTWVVQSFKRTGPYDNAETFDMTLNSHGPVIYVPAP